MRQVGSRLGIFWGIVWSVPETRVEQFEIFTLPGNPHARLALGLPSMYLCWSVRLCDPLPFRGALKAA